MVFLVYADANEPRKPNTATVSNTGGRKTPKTLSGIETITTCPLGVKNERAGKHLKPYQGLKHAVASQISACVTVKAGKHLKPYQGLKRS